MQGKIHLWTMSGHRGWNTRLSGKNHVNSVSGIDSRFRVGHKLLSVHPPPSAISRFAVCHNIVVLIALICLQGYGVSLDTYGYGRPFATNQAQQHSNTQTAMSIWALINITHQSVRPFPFHSLLLRGSCNPAAFRNLIIHVELLGTR